MLNKEEKQPNMQSEEQNQDQKRNNLDDPALLDYVTSKMNAITSNKENDFSMDFKNKLKQEILEKRNKTGFMNTFNVSFQQIFASRYVRTGAIAVLILAIVSTSSYFLQLTNKDTRKIVGIPQKISEIVVPSAHAYDNFTVTPIDGDSLGVDGKSGYILKSQEEFSDELIKDYISIQGITDFDIKTISKTEWHIFPKNQAEANSLITIELPALFEDNNGEMHQRTFSWTYQVKDSLKIMSTVPHHKATGVPTNTGIEFKFSYDTVDVEKFGEYFSIVPEVQGKFEKHDRTIVFVPTERLNDQAVYTATVNKNVALKNSDEQMAEDFVIQFETEGFKSYPTRSFDIYQYNYEFDDEATPYFRLNRYYGQNLSTLDVTIYKFNSSEQFITEYLNKNQHPTWSNAFQEHKINTDNLTKVSTFVGEIVEQNYNQLVLFPESLSNGFYVASITDHVATEQVILQVSPLAAYSTVTQTDSLIWLNNTKTDNVVAGAEISFINMNLDSVKTNDKGVAKFETPKQLLDEQKVEYPYNVYNNYYVKIAKDRHEIVSPLQTINDNYYIDIGWTHAVNNYWSYLYTDKPLYYPNDTIQLWGFAKSRDGEEVKNVEVTLEDYYYWDYFGNQVPIAKDTIELQGNSFESSMNITNVKPGYYQLYVKVDGETIYSKGVQIEDYKKPAYTIDVAVDKKNYYVGDTVIVKGSTKFFDGTPVPELKVDLNVYDKNIPLTTDENGEYSYSFTAQDSYNCYNNYYSCSPQFQTVHVESTRPELGDIRGSSSFTVYSSSRKMDREIDYKEKGKAHINLTSYKVQEKENGDFVSEKIAPGTKFTAKTTKITYTKVETGTYYDYINKTSYKQYDYKRNEEVVDSSSFETNIDGKYTIVQEVEPETSYEVYIEFFDEKGRKDHFTAYVYYYDGFYTSMYSGSDEYYNFEVDSTILYDVGDMVKIPYKKGSSLLPTGQNDFLFYQAQRGLQEYTVQNTAEYQFEFEPKDIPNVQPYAVYFDGSTYHENSGSWFQQGVKYDYSKADLDISLEVDKESYAPGEEIEVTVQTRDKNGKAIAADVNLNLVDEALYALVSEDVDPLSELYQPVNSGVISSYSSHEKSLDLYGGAEGGGCFGAGTQITMADGSTKNIEDIQVGDKVQTFSNPLRQEIVTGTVTKTFEHIISEYLVINEELVVTPEHIVYSNGRFKQAGEMKLGDWMLQDDGQRYAITSIEQKKEIIPVYNFRVDPQHTYFANGLYVHNDKGGGARALFLDVALFDVVSTNANGVGKLKMTLPDNITSWRLTAQAITDNLQAGSSTTNIIVTKDAFVDVTIGDTYLEGEKPQIRLRSYGKALKSGDKISYNLFEDGLSTDVDATSVAFKPSYLAFSKELKHGNYKPVYSMESEAGNDSVILPLKVIGSRLTKNDTTESNATTNFTVRDDESFVEAVILDKKSSLVYYPLLNLMWSYGERVDQAYARYYGRQIAKEKLNLDVFEEEFNAFSYQRDDGGISLLPYSSSDLDWSARVAFVGAQDVDAQALSGYFMRFVNEPGSNQEEVSYALAGLAALRQPILPKIKSWLETKDLTPRESLVLSYGLERMGASQWAYDIYSRIVNKHAVIKKDLGYINVGKTPDDIFQSTLYAAVIGAKFQDDKYEGFWKYTLENQKIYGDFANSENLFTLEKIGFINTILSQPYSGEITFEFFGEKHEKNLFTDGPITLRIAQDQKDSFKVVSTKGDIVIQQTVQKPIDFTKFQTVDNDIKIDKEYYVNGKKTTVFGENDIIEVRLIPGFNKGALQDTYQITDTIPSGLKPITYWQDVYNDNSCSWRHYETVDHQVKYTITKNTVDNYCSSRYISYFVKVETKGEFKAEPALIQSFKNPEIINYSAQQEIKVN